MCERRTYIDRDKRGRENEIHTETEKETNVGKRRESARGSERE